MSDNTPNGSPSDVPEGYPGAPTPPPAANPATPPSAYYPQPSAPAYGAQQPGYPAPQPGYPAAPGYSAAPGYGYAPAQKTNGLAVTSLIASIAAFVIVPFIGSVVGVITGHLALKQLKTNGEAGRGLALAGTIVGWVGVGLSIIGLVVGILWFSWVFTEIANSPGYSDSYSS